MSNEALGLPQISAIGVVSLEPGLLPDDTIRWDGTQWQIVQNDRVGVPLHLPGAPPAFNPTGSPPDANAGYLYKKNGLPGLYWYPDGGPEINLVGGGGGGGIPVIGSSTNQAIVRWGGVNGDALLNSGVTLTNSNEFFQGLKRIIAFGSATENTAVGADAIRNASGNRNTTVGYEAGFSHTTAADNTFVGHNAGRNATVQGSTTGIGAGVLENNNGAENAAVGYHSMQANSIGTSNVGVGYNTLSSNTTGSNNTALGNRALQSSVTADMNTAVGSNTLTNNTVSDNTAVGGNSLATNTTGTHNAALGDRSLESNTIGNENTAVGSYSLANNSTGSTNVAVGSYSLTNNSTGSNNTAVGSRALIDNTSDNNTAFGFQAMESNTTGTGNTAIGMQALMVNNGDQNTALGYNAGFGNTTGNNNIFVGWNTGQSNTTGGNNVLLGTNADVDTAGRSGAIVIGASTTSAAADNSFTVRSASVRNQTGPNLLYFDNTTGEISRAAVSGLDHGGLAGLADNDHPQYLLRDGTNAMTGNLNMGSQNITTAATIQVAAGAVTTPSVTFTGDTNTGIYSSTADTINFTTGGISKLTLNTLNLTSTLPIVIPNGSTAAPSLTFTTEQTGLSLPSAGILAFSVAGSSQVNISSSRVATGIPIYVANGSAAAPSYSFSNDTDTGIYGNSLGAINFSCDGSLRGYFNPTGLYVNSGSLFIQDGSVSAPALRFQNDTDTGIYGNQGNAILLSCGGVSRAYANVNGFHMDTGSSLFLQDGAAATPGLRFLSDTNTGIYSSAADTLNITTGGVNRLGVNTSAVTSTLPIVAPVGNYGSPGFQFGASSGIYKYDTNTIEIAQGLAGDGGGAYLARFSPLGGWSQIRTSNGGLTKPAVFIDQQYYGGNLNAESGMLSLGDAYTSTGIAWNHIICWNNGGNSFRVQGNGAVFADNAYSSSGADYAEYFESLDGKSIPIGSSVVLVDGKIRQANITDLAADIIGVIRPKNSTDVAAISNVFEDYWSGKYEKDEFGAPVEEEFTAYNWAVDGKMVSYHADRIPAGVVVPETKNTVTSTRLKWSPGYDPESVYVPRSQRTEWHVVGLLGQIPIKNGEIINPRWVLMGNISDGSVAKKYLVR